MINDVVATARKLANGSDDFVIEIFERRDDIGDAAKFGTRRYDAVIRTGGVDYQLEMKSWDPARFHQYMRYSIDGLRRFSGSVDEAVDLVPGQMSKDLIEAMRQVDLQVVDGRLGINENLLSSTMTKRWRFDSRMTESYGDAGAIADEIVGLFKEDPNLIEQLIIKSANGLEDLDEITPEIIEDFANGPLRDVLAGMMVI